MTVKFSFMCTNKGYSVFMHTTIRKYSTPKMEHFLLFYENIGRFCV